MRLGCSVLSPMPIILWRGRRTGNDTTLSHSLLTAKTPSWTVCCMACLVSTLWSVMQRGVGPPWPPPPPLTRPRVSPWVCRSAGPDVHQLQPNTL